MTDAYPIHTLSDYRAWALNHPNAAKLLKEVLFQWRGSNMKVRGKPGHWTVYPRDFWCQKTGLSLDQLKRALKVLEIDQLVLRERHRFNGSEVRTYLQPTSRSVDFAGKSGDKDRLGAAYQPFNAPSPAPANAPTSAPTDYTSIPSLTSISTETSSSTALSGGAVQSTGASPEGEGPSPPKSPPLPKKTVPLPIQGSMADIWEKGMEAGSYFAGLDAKQAGQLAMFRKKCPPGYAGNILSHVLENWQVFVECAKMQAAAFLLPASPETGFVLKNVQSAIHLWMDHHALKWNGSKLYVSQPEASLPKAPVPLPSPITAPTAVPEDEKPATLEEVLKILSG